MITISEWAATFARARAEIPALLEAEVKTYAEVAAERARGFIGHLQPPHSVASPAPAYFPAWDPLAPSTQDDKKNLGFGPPDYDPLYRTGQGEQSIEALAVGLTGGVVSDDKVMFYHEVGTVNMPPRPVFAPAVALTMPALAAALSSLAVNVLKPRP